MKILLLRHGEALDDIENRYGGWADHELTNNGREQILKRLPQIQELGINFEKIYSSPLKRAREIAEIVTKNLDLPLEEHEYAREHNRYGILSGMKKEDALGKYPEEVRKLENDELIDGAESRAMFHKRVKKALDFLTNHNYENVILVTHGGFLRAVLRIFLNKEISKVEDCGFLLINYDGKNMEVLKSKGIEFN